ncbi:hypothetical protein [Georgenia alba]|uniref:Uncharacterized protein n=1 Tax=Georgenia alba TaxID=2233858 RepID=A0ABW2QCX9_9MICO
MRTPHRTARLALAGATATTGLAAALGLIWLTRPDTGFFYSNPENAMLASLAGTTAATVVHTIVALLGLAAGIAALAGVVSRGAIVATAVLQVLTFGIVLGSMGTLATAGYLVAMAMPAILLLILLQVTRRYPVARWTLGLPALLAAGAGVILGRDAIGGVLGNLGTGLAEAWPRLVVVLLLIGVGFAWAAAAAAAAAGTPAAARATAWVTRHRKLFTVVAALGPLPYALMRLTWLTPWSLDIPAEDLTMSTRIWGLTLSSGAWLGIVLTLGLIRRWGEVWPRWMPRVASRPVPVAAAAVPGGVVATVLIFTAVPMLYTGAREGLAEFLTAAVAFPCWFWGPALALAVWGYVGHRRGETSIPDVPASTGAATV